VINETNVSRQDHIVISFTNTLKESESASSKTVNQKTKKPAKSVFENMLDVLREWITIKTLEHMGLIVKEITVR